MMDKRENVMIRILTLILLLPLFLSTSSLSGELLPREVVQAAEAGLQPFLAAIPSDELGYYGFSSEAEFIQATLGEPFRVYKISPNEILNYSSQVELASLLSATNLWCFPVLCLGQARAVLTVDLMNGEWRAVAIGSSGLARELEKLRAAWPQTDGYEHKFLRVFQAQSDFLVVSKEGKVKLVALSSAALALQLEARPDGLYEPLDPAEVIPKLAPIVEDNLQMQGTQ